MNSRNNRFYKKLFNINRLYSILYILIELALPSIIKLISRDNSICYYLKKYNFKNNYTPSNVKNYRNS